MTPAQIERLALLIEECAEAQQAACKSLRHGYDSINPLEPMGPDNQSLLEKEIGHVQHAIDRLCEALELDPSNIERARKAKAASIGRWLHHQGADR
jgi:hypothetical protein